MDWIKQIIRWGILMLLQVLLINNLHFFNLCHPYIYIFSLLVFPVTLPRWTDMLIGIGVGLIMDVFCNSLGVHMASCVLLMFLRPYLLHLLTTNQERIIGEINISNIGEITFIKYAVILTTIFHLLIFSLTVWSIRLWWFVLLETVVSTLVCCIIIIGYDFIRNR